MVLNKGNKSSNLDKGASEASKRSRKGHTKSRRGCLNCKQARIKCKENRPACDYCAHRNLCCKWPDLRVVQAQFISGPTVLLARPEVTTPIDAFPLQTYNISTQPVSSNHDLRLFNHFIDAAYPHQPAGNDSKWKHEIPCISTEFDYLLHAMLALSASDIASQTNETALTLTALTHRTQSITALNSAINNGITSPEAGNAMLATCFALLFQSTLLNDGLGEYMSFIRGCIAIGMCMASKKYTFIFANMFGDEQMKMLDPKMLNTPLIEANVVRAACRSLEKMKHLCVTKVEIEMFGLLLAMARDLVTSSRDACMSLRKIYALFSYHMPYLEFREFTDTENEVCQLLQAHFVAMQLIMTPITRNEWDGRENATAGGGDGKSFVWLENIHARIRPGMRCYYEWTLEVETQAQARKVLTKSIGNGL